MLLALVDDLEQAEAWLDLARQVPPPAAELRSFVENWEPLAEAAIAVSRLRLPEAHEALARRPRRPGLPRRGAPRRGRGRAGPRHRSPRAGRGGPRRRGPEPGPRPGTGAGRARAGDAEEALVEAVSALGEDTLLGRIDLLLVAALAQERLGRRDEALDDLSRARGLARANGTALPFALVPRAELLALASRLPEGAAEVVAAVEPLPELVVEPRRAVELSEREKAVLAELAVTRSLREIAERSFVSVNTVKSQVRSLYRKLGMHSRSEALQVAEELGFVLGAREGRH